MAERAMRSSEDAEESLKLDARIARALDLAPEVEIPANFAARVAAKMSEGKAASMKAPTSASTPAPSRYGRNTAVVCLVILLAVIYLAARHAATSPIWTSIESLLCLQLALLATGLTVGAVRSGMGWFS